MNLKFLLPLALIFLGGAFAGSPVSGPCESYFFSFNESYTAYLQELDGLKTEAFSKIDEFNATNYDVPEDTYKTAIYQIVENYLNLFLEKATILINDAERVTGLEGSDINEIFFADENEISFPLSCIRGQVLSALKAFEDGLLSIESYQEYMKEMHSKYFSESSSEPWYQ